MNELVLKKSFITKKGKMFKLAKMRLRLHQIRVFKDIASRDPLLVEIGTKICYNHTKILQIFTTREHNIYFVFETLVTSITRNML